MTPERRLWRRSSQNRNECHDGNRRRTYDCPQHRSPANPERDAYRHDDRADTREPQSPLTGARVSEGLQRRVESHAYEGCQTVLMAVQDGGRWAGPVFRDDPERWL